MQDLRLINLIALAFFLLALINTLVNFFFSDLNVFRVVSLKLASSRLEDLIRIEEKRNKELKEILSKVESDPKYYREKILREVFLMFKEGEKVIPLPEDLWYKRK